MSLNARIIRVKARTVENELTCACASLMHCRLIWRVNPRSSSDIPMPNSGKCINNCAIMSQPSFWDGFKLHAVISSTLFTSQIVNIQDLLFIRLFLLLFLTVIFGKFIFYLIDHDYPDINLQYYCQDYCIRDWSVLSILRRILSIVC